MEKPKPTRVRRIDEIARKIDALTVENVLDRMPEPGQFIMVWNGQNEKPMAVSKIKGDDLTIIVKRVGPFTEALHRSMPGDILGLRGPYGRPFDLSYKKPLLVGGGIGASPLLYLASNLVEKECTVRIFAGFNISSDAICVEEFRGLGDTTICTVDGSLGLPGMITENLPRLGEFDCVLTCGPEAMMVAVAKDAEKAGTECQLLVERYFKCGIGLCGSCSLGRLIVCKDGPVFFWRELKGTEFGEFKRDACGLRKVLS